MDATTPGRLVGRDEPMAELRALVAGALTGRGGLVALTGEAGIGKTALAAAAADHAEGLGATAVLGSCWEGARPFWPWLEVLGAVGAVLLSRPGRPVPAAELVARSGGGRARAEVALGADPVLDEQAKRAYRGRLAELDARLAEADELGDADGAERARAERAAVARELATALGLGGGTGAWATRPNGPARRSPSGSATASPASPGSIPSWPTTCGPASSPARPAPTRPTSRSPGGPEPGPVVSGALWRRSGA